MNRSHFVREVAGDQTQRSVGSCNKLGPPMSDATGNASIANASCLKGLSAIPEVPADCSCSSPPTVEAMVSGCNRSEVELWQFVFQKFVKSERTICVPVANIC